MLADSNICEDVVQNAFIKLYENFETVRNKNSIIFWLLKTVRNEIYQHYRKRNIHVDRFNVQDADEIEISSGDGSIAEELENRELKEIIMAALDEFPIAQKDIFLLKEYGGLSYKEIAEMLDITEKLVKDRLYKARQKLIKIVSKKLAE